jgi:hypothetical protein
VAILIDGIHFGEQMLVVALGIESSGKKHVLLNGLFTLPNLNAAFRRLHEAAFLLDVS